MALEDRGTVGVYPNLSDAYFYFQVDGLALVAHANKRLASGYHVLHL
jgi:hypothetical protein